MGYYSRRLVLCFSLLVVFLAGCVSHNSQATSQISAFAIATSLAMDNTMEAFQAVELRHTEMIVARLSMDYEKEKFRPDIVKPFLPPEALEARRQVFTGLKRYAELLTVIMGDQQLREFDAATVRLGQTLAKVDSDLVAKHYLNNSVVGTDGINIFTTAVNSIGRWMIDSERERNVRHVVNDMKHPVSDICQLIRLDIGENHEKTGLRNDLWNAYDSTMTAQDTFIRNAIKKNTLDPIALRSEIRTLTTLVSDQRHADEALAATRDALQALADAHDRLAEAFEDHPIALPGLLERLVNESQRIKAFYDAMTPKK